MVQKVLLSVVLFLSFSLGVFSQNKGFNFQGYARSDEGAALSSQSVVAEFNIYIGENTKVYAERHTVTTDVYGYFSAIVGKGSEVLTGRFDTLRFDYNDYIMEVKVGLTVSDLVLVNKTELLSVPYAKAAENGVPAGTILPFGGPESNIPSGYLACDGDSYAKSAYPKLFAAIDKSWGGSGTNFNVPDLRGYFLRGLDASQGNDPNSSTRTAKNGGNAGDKVGSYQNDDYESHTHEVKGDTKTDGAHVHNGNQYYTADNDDNDDAKLYVTADGQTGNGNTKIESNGSAHKHTIDFKSGSSGGNETRPKNAYVLFIIKY